MSSDLTVECIRWALQAQALRAETAASNIARSNMNGVTGKSVDFASQLEVVKQLLAQANGNNDDWNSVISHAGVVYTLQGAPGAHLSADAEVADMSDAAGRYAALTEGISRHFSLIEIAISKGR